MPDVVPPHRNLRKPGVRRLHPLIKSVAAKVMAAKMPAVPSIAEAPDSAVAPLAPASSSPSADSTQSLTPAPAEMTPTALYLLGWRPHVRGATPAPAEMTPTALSTCSAPADGSD